MAPYPKDSEVLIDLLDMGQLQQYPSLSSLDSSMKSLPVFDPPTGFFNEEPSAHVEVEVSGVSFLVSPGAFQRLGRLPWERIHSTAYRLEGSSPDAFEKVLDFVLFRTMPKRKHMSKLDQEELITMAQQLGLSDLIQLMQSKKGAGYQKKNCLGVLFGCKRSQASDVESCYGYRQNRTNTFTTN